MYSQYLTNWRARGGRESIKADRKSWGLSFPSRAKDNLYEMSVSFWTLMERTGVKLGIGTHALMTQSLPIGGWSLAKPAKTSHQINVQDLIDFIQSFRLKNRAASFQHIEIWSSE